MSDADHTRAESDHSRAEEDHASIADKVSQEELAAAIEPLASKDGYYGGMTVGSAENLVGRGSVEAKYSGVRTSAGQEDIGSGSAQIVRLKGNSVKFNQLVSVDFAQAFNSEKVSITKIGNKVDAEVLEGGKGYTMGIRYYAGAGIFPYAYGHIYLMIVTILCSKSARWRFENRDNSNLIYVEGNKKNRCGFFMTATNQNQGFTNGPIVKSEDDLSVGDTYSLEDANYYDLTAIFGPGNEPETVEDFEAWLAENVGVRDCYPYTQPTIINNAATGIRTRGFNLYNNATGKAYLPGTYSDYPHEYEICGTFTSISYTDINGKTYVPELTDGRFFNVDAPGELTVVGGNATDTLVHLVWSGWRNEGEPDYVYEPYWESLLPLNITTLTGKLNGEGNSVTIVPNGLAKVGDVADYGIVENGMLTKIVKCIGVRAYQSGDENDSSVLTDNTDTYYVLSTPQVYVLDTPISMNYRVDDFGTEQAEPAYTDTLTAPFVYDVQYAMNAVDTIRRLIEKNRTIL